MKVAVLSNINADYMIRQLEKEYEVYHTTGYGSLYENLLNHESGYYVFQAECTIIWVDLMELVGHDLEEIHCLKKIDECFQILESHLIKNTSYLIMDGDYRGYDRYLESGYQVRRIENYWCERLEQLTKKYENVYPVEYKSLCERMGREQFYSPKLWYMGKMILSPKAVELLTKELHQMVRRLKGGYKKVLLLDLDNTLWGGVIGEEGFEHIQLSDDHVGAAYKDFQQMILKMKKQGVLLGIVSKNNEKDAMEALKNHPHMQLREEDFAAWRINWQWKDQNIREIARELNVGLDSMVFLDDNPVERELVSQSLPDVTVPAFPRQAEKLPEFIEEIYQKYFKKLYVTREDQDKTLQYKQNADRRKLQQSMDYDTFLKELSIRISRVDHTIYAERIHQLINKSNQFNLTTLRLNQAQIQMRMEDCTHYQIYAYRVQDKFGDYGVVGIILVHLNKSEFEATIENFVMSCRVMSKKIENYLIEQVEKDLKQNGYRTLYGIYIPSKKNMPVKAFYDNLGYTLIKTEGEQQIYKLQLSDDKMKRDYYIKEDCEDG